jgi:thiol-disulfide isomerase/thioredoxin
MRVRQAAGVIALAFGAAVAGLVVGSFLDRKGPPAWLTDAMSTTSPGRWLADHWIAATRPAPPPGVAVARKGDRRPDVAMVGLDGQPTTQSSWDGKLVVVNFWASWCTPCREEMPELERFHQAQRANGVEVIGFAIDDPAAVKEFLNSTKVSYPIVFARDALPSPTMLFGNTHGALPYSVLIGRDGRVLEQRLGKIDEAMLAAWIDEAG